MNETPNILTSALLPRMERRRNVAEIAMCAIDIHCYNPGQKIQCSEFLGIAWKKPLERNDESVIEYTD